MELHFATGVAQDLADLAQIDHESAALLEAAGAAGPGKMSRHLREAARQRGRDGRELAALLRVTGLVIAHHGDVYADWDRVRLAAHDLHALERIAILEAAVLAAYLHVIADPVPDPVRQVLERHYLGVKRSLEDLRAPWLVSSATDDRTRRDEPAERDSK